MAWNMALGLVAGRYATAVDALGLLGGLGGNPSHDLQPG
jgi:hypothetical protein